MYLFVVSILSLSTVLISDFVLDLFRQCGIWGGGEGGGGSFHSMTG